MRALSAGKLAQCCACASGAGEVACRPFFMIYSFTLKSVMLLVGLLLIASHLFAMLRGGTVKGWLRAFPRHKPSGVILTLVLAAWFFWLVEVSDLGEFDKWRSLVQYLTPVSAILAILFMQEFLAVRALGGLMLMAAEPLLESAFMREEQLRLLLVVLTYVWLIAGMFWVGMPYTLRDQISWVTSSEKRWRATAFAGLAYGALLCVGGLLCR